MKKGIVLIIALFAASSLFAQRRGNIGFGLQVADPEGAYEASYGGTPVGLGINGSFPLTHWSPLELGFDMGFTSMGRERTNVDIFDGLYYQRGDVTIASSSNAYHLQARFKPFNGRIKPYVDAIAGVKSHKTTIDVDYTDGFESADLFKDVLERKVTESYGLGIGLQVEMAPHVNLDVKYQHLRGGSTSFVDMNSVDIFDAETYTYNMVNTSSSDLNLLQVGISFDF